MASQQQPPPSRPWLRLASIARAAPPPTPAAAPPAPSAPAPQAPPPPVPAPVAVLQPRLPVSLPTFRPMAPPQEPTPPAPAPPPPPPAPAPAPPSLPTAPQIPERSELPAAAAAPPRAAKASLPSSPQVKTIAAPTSFLPASPAKRPSPPPPPATLPTEAISAPPPPPKPQVSSPVRKSPLLSPPKPTKNGTRPVEVPVPVPSPRIIKPSAQTPPQSPTIKAVAPPPSPLILPPSQIRGDDREEIQPKIPVEAEQKTVLVQETIQSQYKHPPSLNGQPHPPAISKPNGITRDAKNGDAEKQKGLHKKHQDAGEASGVKVITMAGENKGAMMELMRSPNHPLAHQLRKMEKPKSGIDGSSSDEGKQEKNKSHRSMVSSPPMNAFMNSNVQGVNNSILYNSSCTHHDPGVHLVLSRKPSNGAFHTKDLVKGRPT